MINKAKVNQRTAAPTRKQNFNLLGAQTTTVAMVMLAMFAPLVYGRIPEGMEGAFGSALGGIVGYAFGWFAKERA